MQKIRHTIFTPVFNRKDGIIVLFEKIKNLEYSKDNFEWLIIDDGSTDNLREIVEGIINSQSGIDIRYFYKENGGIHTAQNLAIRMANGEYITRIDSDDYLLPSALINKDIFLEKIPNGIKNKVIGVVGLCLNMSDGTVRGTKFPLDEQITTGIALKKKGAKGDRNFCMKTEVMKNFLIPEYPDTRWVPEGSALWLKIDRNYLTYFVNVPFSVCSEPSVDSFSGQMSQITPSNIMSKYYDILELLNHSKDLVSYKEIIIDYIRIGFYALCGEKITKNNLFRRMFRDLQHPLDKLAILLLIPFSWLFYLIKSK